MKVYDRLDRQYEMFADEYRTAAIRVLDSAWYVLGKEVENFEKAYAEYMGVKYCVGLNSGLDALILSVRALGIGEGDEVIVPGNTYIASVIGITENRATPVFVEPDEFHNLDADKIESAITEKTKAIMVVHLYGQAANMGRIRKIADKYNLYLIEDCAQSHGASFNGKLTGTWGDAGCFSFYPTKALGAFGDAGAVVSDNKEFADTIRKMRNYGSNVKYYNEISGINSRLDELQAALLITKLPHLNSLNEERKELAQKYLEGINNPKIILPKTRDGAEHIYHLFVIMCEERDDLQKYLAECGIKAQIHYPIPPHLQNCYKNLNHHEGSFPVTEYYAKHVLSLPFYNGMTNSEIEHVIDSVNKY